MPKKAVKILRNIIIFLVIFGVMFSNIPFYAVSSALNAYIKSYNIVDKAWHLQKDSNVVDKFASFRNLTEELKIKETYAATSGAVYPTLGVTVAESPWLDNNWTNPTNVYSDDAATAYVIAASFDSPDQTFVLKATGFDFSAIPDGSTINGVTARMNAWYRTSTGAGAMDLCQLLDISKAKVGTNQCATQVALTTNNTTIITKGSTSDKWGNALDTAWIKDPDFGIAIGIKATAANADVDVDYVTLEIDYTPPADTAPPTPNPMTFATPPTNSSASQIDMTATAGSDPSTPINYLFTNDNSGCAANAGTGGTSSSWQAGTTYSDTGLDPNKCYGFTVQARDSLLNTGTASGVSSTYTSANTPGTPTLNGATESTLNLTNAENSNPASNPTTNFAVQVVTTSPNDSTWLNQWVDATGSPSASAVWLTDAQMDALVLQGLQASTLYGVKVKAKNNDNEETALSAEGQGTTSAPSNALTVSTSGSQAANLNSGDAAQHIGGGSTAAFQLRMSTTAVNVNSVKLTEQGGSITLSDLTSQKLYYESGSTCTYNGIESNVTATPTGETVTFSLTGVQAPIAPNYLCLYYVFDLNGTNAVGGETIDIEITNPSTDVVLASGQNTDTVAKQLTGTTTVKPQITGYTNSTDAGLNYAGSCTGCGARIGSSAVSLQQRIVITGSGFGSDPGLGSRDTASNKVEIVGTSTTLISDNGAGNSNINTTDPSCGGGAIWTPTCIVITTDTTVTGNADADWGTNYGGASALKVTIGGQSVPTNLNYYIFPQVSSIASMGSPGAREYDSGDTDGVITINGTRFGATQGSGATGGYVKILGCDSSACPGAADGSVTIDSWGNTQISARVPTVIGDGGGGVSDYVGNLTVRQGASTNNKTHSYTNSFRILPRITSITPSADGVNPNTRTLNGNHFCQSGSCLSAALWNAANDDGDDVKFGTTNATVTGTPSDMAVEVTVPVLTPGGYTVTLYSNSGSSYASNGKPFTYLDNTPANPSSLNQYQSNCSTVITDETTTASSTVCLKGAVSGGVTGGTLYLQVEVRDSATAFTAATAESTGASAPSGGTESVSVTPGQGTFKWRARTCHNNGGTHNLTCTGTGDYPSAAWVEFETGAVPTNDFTIDSNGPVISNISSGTPGEFSVIITWDTNELATSNVNYGTTTTGPYNFIAPNPADTTADTTTPHSVSISTNLNCGTIYYYIVKSVDVQGTLTTSAEQTFTTGTCNPRVMKSVEFDWVEEISPVMVTTQLNRTIVAANTSIQESSDTDFTIRSAVLEMRGVIIDDATTTKPTLNLWINNATAPAIPIDFPDTPSQDPQAFTVRYNIAPANLNISPLSSSENIVHFQFGGGFSKSSLVNIKLIITYDYTP